MLRKKEHFVFKKYRTLYLIFYTLTTQISKLNN